MKIMYKTPLAPAFDLNALKGPHVGIELEYENVHSERIDLSKMKMWHMDIDHSLRTGGIEFISKVLKPAEVNKALEEVAPLLEVSGAKVTKRTGVHIHLNVSDLTFMQLWSVATYYQLLEAFIFKKFADGREDNHFCVPQWSNTNLQEFFYRDAVRLYRGVTKQKRIPSHSDIALLSDNAYRNKVPLNILNNSKYSAMNLASLKTFGTLEFRQMRGTLDMCSIKEWASFLINMREAAISYPDFESILEEYDQNGFTKLCEDVGLPQSQYVNADDLVDCVDAAFIMVGHAPTNHQDLTWEIN